MIEQEQPPSLPPGQPAPGHAARRVAINALSPFAAQLVTKVLMLGYLIVQYRLVNGERLGEYILATIVFSYTSTIGEWGLSTLLTREVAKLRGAIDEPARATVLFRQTLGLRLAISLALFVPVAAFTVLYVAFFNLDVQGAWAVGLLTLSLLPSAFSSAVTALLYAYERMSLPAAIGVVTSLVNVVLGVGAIVLGWGILGLAAAALATTIITAIVFARILRHDFPGQAAALGEVRLAAGWVRPLLSAGWPLMLNALLVGLFFRVDTFVIQADYGGLQVAQYQAAYSFLNFVLLITPAVTLALFPRMSRHAATDRPRLAYEYAFALKLLLILSVPVVTLTVWFAPLLITIVTGGKAGYLAESSLALRILIFFLPFSFVNGLTQYVLIALDRQRLITKAFAATVAFNLAANLFLVPILGIDGAALTTILSELVLLWPFLRWTGQEIGAVPIGALSIKPLAAALPVVVASALLRGLAGAWSDSPGAFTLYLLAGLGLLALYLGGLALLRPFGESEWQTLRGALRRG